MKQILVKYKNKLNFPLDDSDINQIIVYLQNGQLKKLHFEYGDLILDVCLEYAESKEDYYLCAKLKKFYEEINRYRRD